MSRQLLFRGERVDRAVVALGDEVQVGDTVLRVEESTRTERRIYPRTLMTGESDAVRAAALLYSLSDVLRKTDDLAEIGAVANEWARNPAIGAQ